MRRELTVYVRDPVDTTEGRLSELVASCGASAHEIRPEEPRHGFTPHVIVMEGDQASLDAVMRLFLTEGAIPDLKIGAVMRLFLTEGAIPDLKIGQVSVRDT